MQDGVVKAMIGLYSPSVLILSIQQDFVDEGKLNKMQAQKFEMQNLP